MSIAFRTHAIKVSAKREIRSTLQGIGIYLTLSLILLGASYFFVKSALDSAMEAGVLAYGNPLTVPFYFTVGLAAAYLGLCSALSVSRDRDQGTLEVLFYGPVDTVSYLLAKLVHQLFAFLVVLVFALVNFYIVSRITNLGFSSDFVGFLVLSVFLTMCMVCFGMFLSVASRRVMASVIVFLGLVLFFLIFEIAHGVIISLPSAQMTPFLIYVRVIIDNVYTVVQWLSPISYFNQGMNAVFMSDVAQYVISLAASIVYSGILFALSVWLFNKKGVRR